MVIGMLVAVALVVIGSFSWQATAGPGPTATLSASGFTVQTVGSVNGNVTSTRASSMPAPGLDSKMAEFRDAWKIVKGAFPDQLSQKTMDFVPKSGLTLDRSKTTTYTDGSRYLVNVALTGNNVVAPAGATFLFSKDGELSSTTELAIWLAPDGSARGAQWTDGSQDFDQSFASNGSKLSTEQAQTVGWNEFVNCMNSMGVPQGLITLLGFICGAVCLGTAGAGCVPCLAVGAGSSAGIIWSCVGQGVFFS